MDTYIFMLQGQSYALELILEQNKKKINQPTPTVFWFRDSNDVTPAGN